MYSDKTVQMDHDYLNYAIVTKGTQIYYYDGDDYHLGERSDLESFTFSESNVYWGEYLMEEYCTEQLVALMSRHGYQYNTDDKIYRSHINAVKNRIDRLNEAKVFVWQPILGKDFNNHKKRSFYHELLQMNWGMGMIMLLFLPTLLFLVSAFGIRNVLVSGFSTALIAGLSLIVVEMLMSLNYHTEERMLTVYSFVAFALMLTLLLGRQRLQSWNYIAGVFMLVLGVVFVTSFIVIASNYRVSDNIIPSVVAVLPFSLIASLVAAWMIAKRNDQPVLR